MKTASAGLDAHTQGESTTLATCWKVKRTDGMVQGFTEHDRDLSIDLGDGDGAVTYKAATGYTRTAITTSADLKADNLEVDGVLDSAGISEADLDAGLYDHAEVKIFLVNHAELSQGVIKLRKGFLGEVTQRGEMFVAELQGLMGVLAQELSELYTPDCRADLGDGRCKVRLDPPMWSASAAVIQRPAREAGLGSVVKPSVFNDRYFECVTAGTTGASEPAWNTTLGATTNDGTAVWMAEHAMTLPATVDVMTSNREFTITVTTDAPDALLTGGLLTFTSGANAGLKREVKSWDLATKKVVTFLAFPFTVANGDGLTITAGCDKTVAVCRDTFDNIHNLRGEPYVPGIRQVIKYPDSRR